jgi:flagellar motor switch/type III secretory pathway protein FliN
MWEEAGWLPCLVSVDLPLRRFTVRTLLRLEPGTVLESNLADGADLPVSVNSQLIGWGEFEIVGQGLAVRLTELA